MTSPEWLQSMLVETVGWVLVHSLWQLALVGGPCAAFDGIKALTATFSQLLASMMSTGMFSFSPF